MYHRDIETIVAEESFRSRVLDILEKVSIDICRTNKRYIYICIHISMVSGACRVRRHLHMLLGARGLGTPVISLNSRRLGAPARRHHGFRASP